MRQDSRSVLDYWLGLHIRNDEPEGLFRLRHIASAVKEKDPKSAKWLKQALIDMRVWSRSQEGSFTHKKKRTPELRPMKSSWSKFLLVPT